jgi:hypothetical protein
MHERFTCEAQITPMPVAMRSDVNWLASRFAARQEEHLFAVDPETLDGRLAWSRCDPLVPNPGICGIYRGVFGWIDEDAAIGIKQARVTFEEDVEIAPAFKIAPGGAVGETIGIELARYVEGGTHPLPRLAIPATCRLELGRFPLPELHPVRTAVVATRNKGTFCSSDPGESFPRRLGLANSGRVRLGADDDEIIEHHRPAIDAVPLGHEFLLAGAVMHQEGIGIASCTDGKRLSGSNGHDPYGDSGLRLKEGQDVGKETRLFGRGGRGKGNRALLRRRTGSNQTQ